MFSSLDSFSRRSFLLLAMPLSSLSASISNPLPFPLLTKRAANVTCGADPRMPPGSWDSHLHVMDPSRYPVDLENPYTPGIYTVWNNAIFESSIGCEHVVFVASTTHGHDMSIVLDSLKAYGTDRARAIALFDHDNATETAQLEAWNEAGFRGVRVNFVTFADEVDPDALKKELQVYADLIRPYDWVIQLYIKMETIPLIEDVLPTLGVKIVFDHQGDPVLPEPQDGDKKDCRTVDPYQIEGFSALARLVESKVAYVKISGSYRFMKRKDSLTYEDVDPITKELLRLGPTRTVFGSDWPHTRFDDLDIHPWVRHLLDLTDHDQELRERLFRDNARVLWGVDEE